MKPADQGQYIEKYLPRETTPSKCTAGDSTPVADRSNPCPQKAHDDLPQVTHSYIHTAGRKQQTPAIRQQTALLMMPRAAVC